ncbi:MAG: hypothetical protein U1E56_01890 [Bauldia sp.]
MRASALLLVAAIVAAFGGISSPGRADEAADARYRVLLAAAKSDPASVDFREFRATYAKSSRYKGDSSDPLVFAMSKPTAEQAAAFVDDNFVILGTQTFAASRYPQGSPERQFHLAVAARILGAMLAGRDGRSADSAIRVLTVTEEYTAIGLLGLQRRGTQSLRNVNGKPYDTHAVAKDTPGGAPQEFDLWFDLTDLFAANAQNRLGGTTLPTPLAR